MKIGRLVRSKWSTGTSGDADSDDCGDRGGGGHDDDESGELANALTTLHLMTISSLHY